MAKVVILSLLLLLTQFGVVSQVREGSVVQFYKRRFISPNFKKKFIGLES
jgi:hypothetical protein